ncbi:MAG: VWA domain-containing protein [Verrucomicrobiales bacterium]|nr:VWA domain-containing protein [Verrucomicrobiales bacterium]
MRELIANFHFIRPAVLLLGPVVIAIWWLWQRRSDPLRGWRKQIDPVLLKALLVGRESNLRGPARWVLVIWLLAIVAIAGPTWRLEHSPFAEDATPLMILLKSDVSMDTPDPAPSRLERAHLKIADLAEVRKGQPLGLIAYSGSAHLVLPPTRDTAVVAEMAAEVSPGIMPVPGDRLDLALLEAARILTHGEAGGSIVVVADLVDSDPEALSSARREFPFPIQFLQIQSPDSPRDNSLRDAAKVLRASVEMLTVDDGDINAVVRRASSAPVAQSGDQGERWEESGYWLLPLLGVILLASFRREKSEQPTGEVSA